MSACFSHAFSEWFAATKRVVANNTRFRLCVRSATFSWYSSERVATSSLSKHRDGNHRLAFRTWPCIQSRDRPAKSTQDQQEMLIGARLLHGSLNDRRSPAPSTRITLKEFSFLHSHAAAVGISLLKNMPNVQQLSLSNAENPRTSTVAAGNLARLTPVDLMPERYSRHMKIITKLKQIRQVQVSRTGSSKGSYIIDVYTTSQSTTRIPTRLMAADSALAAAKEQQSATLFRRPDVHIEKQFADFVKLRDELYEASHTGPHLYMNCRFCSEVTRYLLFSAVLPGALLTWILPQRQRTKAVQRFVESLLSLAVSCPVIDSQACTCQEKLPRKLYEFFFESSA